MGLQLWILNNSASAIYNRGADTDAYVLAGDSYSVTGGLYGAGYATGSGNTSNHTVIYVPSLANAHCFSVSFFVYIDSSTLSGTWQRMFRAADGGSFIRIESNSSSSGNAPIGVYNNNQNKMFTNELSSSDTSIYDKWIHVVYVYDNITAIKHWLYVDGINVSSASLGTVNNPDGLDGFFYLLNGDTMHINDIRIYDYAIQPKEIHEIGKIELFRFPLELISGNLNSNLLATDVTKTSNWVAVNGSLTQQSAGTYGTYITYTANETTSTRRCYVATSNVWTKGETYYAVIAAAAGTAGTVIRASRSLADFGDSNITLTTSIAVYCVKISCTSTATGGSLSISVNGSDSASVNIYNVVLVKTNTGRLEDASANGCTANGSNISTMSDTVRGNFVNFMNAAPSFALPFWTNQTFQYFTVSIWFKTGYASSGYPNLVSLGQNSFFRIRLQGGKAIWYYIKVGSTSGCTATMYATSNLDDNQWHHCVMTFNSGNTQIFIDGSSIGTSSYTEYGTSLTCSAYTGYIGGYSTSAETWLGQLSDLRIYGTCLSNNDISNLYKTGAYLTNDGGAIVRSLNETTTDTTTKIKRYEFRTPQISELPLKYDHTIYRESDGSMWVRISHQVSGTAFASATTDMGTGVYESEDAWVDYTICNGMSTWEIIIEQTWEDVSYSIQRYRFIQAANPLTAKWADVAGNLVTKYAGEYTEPYSNYGGLYLSSSSDTLISANDGINEYNSPHGAIGYRVAGEIPGYNAISVHTSGYLDSYVRIDNCIIDTANTSASISQLDQTFRCVRITEE